MSELPSVIVKNVSKNFRLPHDKSRSLKDYIVHPSMIFGAKYSNQHALKNIDVEIPEGEFFGIVGRNGSGKSTLLKIIAGIYQPTKGSIKVRGKILPFIELGVGFNPELTGRDNVYLSGALLGFSKKEMDGRYQKIVEFAELEEFMEQKLKNYSSGMQVRLAFSIATQSEADVLLIDEVLAVGDTAFQRKCFNYFKKLKKDNKTVIFVTHDMDAVREYCDRAILIEDSKILHEGDPNDIARQYGELFQDEDTSDAFDEEEIRNGNFDVKYSNVKAPKLLTDKDKTLELSVKLTAKKDTENVILGIAVKDESNLHICGATNRLLNKRLDDLKAGESQTITWTIPNIFHDGRHHIVLAAIDPSETIRYDWWEPAASFDVKRHYHVPYPTQPDIKLRLNKES